MTDQNFSKFQSKINLKKCIYISLYSEKPNRYHKECPWCNGYCCRKWTRRHEFKSMTRLIAFHIALIPLGKV